MSTIEALTLKESPLPEIKLHPTAVFSILSSYVRRTDRDSRVIGTLLGTVKDNVVEVTDCFSFPHTETDTRVEFDVKIAEQMYAFHRRINKQEQIVGWYATTMGGAFITPASSLIHDYYTRKLEQESTSRNGNKPVHVVVDTSLATDNIDVRGFVSRPMKIGVGNLFDDVPVKLEFSDSEATCIHHMINGQGQDAWLASDTFAAVPSEREKALTAMEKLLETLSTLQGYIDGVVEGSQPAKAEVGIAISDALAGLQLVKAEELTSLFQDRSQDLVMISHLSTLTQTQITISERLNSVL